MNRQLEETQDIMNLQIAQAAREIKTLRELQQKTSAFRHDLRQHMQYLFSCIENERIKQARGYIQEICVEIEANKVTVFCENEAANLIFSSFAGRTADYDIPIKIKAMIFRSLPITETDLCVLLSNAMEMQCMLVRNWKKGIIRHMGLVYAAYVPSWRSMAVYTVFRSKMTGSFFVFPCERIVGSMLDAVDLCQNIHLIAAAPRYDNNLCQNLQLYCQN